MRSKLLILRKKEIFKNVVEWSFEIETVGNSQFFWLCFSVKLYVIRIPSFKKYNCMEKVVFNCFIFINVEVSIPYSSD